MRFGSLFAGIGGFDLGFERAGMECAWQVEIDDYCNKVLAKHWPGVKRYGDIRTVGEHNLETVDLICGGFPCQPYSVAGKRKGAEDDRNLWPEYLRIVRELRPAWVVGENVPGIVPMYLDTVLSDLEGEGYTCWTFNIPACALDAPHRRERIFVVAYCENFGDIGRQRFSLDATTESQAGRDNGTGSGKDGGSEDVAYANQQRSQGYGRSQQSSREGTTSTRWTTRGDVPYPSITTERSWWNEKREEDAGNSQSSNDWFRVEPDVGRVADGVPHRVDRLRALGNAVVPQVAEFIGRQIMAAVASDVA